MTDRLTEIKERLAKATKDPIEFVREAEREGWYECPICDIHCPLCENGGGVPGSDWTYKNLAAGIGVFGIGEDLENLEALMKHFPDDIAWLIAELEKERAENARLLNINHGLQMQLDDHLGEQPKVCGECIKNYHTICQWEIEYEPGCVCGCHLARVIT